MKPIQLKVQYQNQDTGEYSLDKDVGPVELMEIFNEETEEVKLKRTKRLKHQRIKFFVSKYDGGLLRLEHKMGREFQVDWGKPGESDARGGDFNLEQVKGFLRWFAEGSYGSLEKALQAHFWTYDELQEDFEEFKYNYTYQGLGIDAFELNRGLYWLYGLITLVVWIASGWFLALAGTIILGLLGILSIELKTHYVKRSRGLSLYVSSTSPGIRIRTGDKEVFFQKSEIEYITRVTGNSELIRAPFSAFAYTEITLKNGEQYFLPFMVIDPTVLRSKLKGVEARTRRVFFPRIKT